MIEKYYTPSKEDYCIGLEYEYHVINNNKANEWVKNTLTQHNFSPDDWFYVFNTNNRLKYLDETDLIELGWEFDSVVKGDYFYVRGNMIEGDYFLTTQDYRFFYIHPGAGVKKDESFVGQVKNKTEMKKLMEMLNIKPPKQN